MKQLSVKSLPHRMAEVAVETVRKSGSFQIADWSTAGFAGSEITRHQTDAMNIARRDPRMPAIDPAFAAA